MSLAVIGAGFGRTGTLSMKAALEILGFGPCHHMLEVTTNDTQRAIWRAIAAGGKPDWAAAFAGYRATVDWPGAYYWRELSVVYPDAKILLTLRDAASWYASVRNTIFPVIGSNPDKESVAVKLIAERIFGGVLDDEERAIAIYEQNTADVQAAFGPERLLTYSIGDGWEPLCRFLERPVPAVPFPRSNSTGEFNARMSASNAPRS
jgi:hypothetical protein